MHPESISTFNLGVYDSYWYFLWPTNSSGCEQCVLTNPRICKRSIFWTQYLSSLRIVPRSLWRSHYTSALAARGICSINVALHLKSYETSSKSIIDRGSPCTKPSEVSEVMYLDSLATFMNLDGRRNKFGEGRLQQAFLQRYHYLKVLQIATYNIIPTNYPGRSYWRMPTSYSLPGKHLMWMGFTWRKSSLIYTEMTTPLYSMVTGSFAWSRKLWSQPWIGSRRDDRKLVPVQTCLENRGASFDTSRANTILRAVTEKLGQIGINCSKADKYQNTGKPTVE